MATYAQQLKDPQWQRRRLERLALSEFRCDNCGDDKTTLHVHHPQYFKGRKAWEYADDELEVLCETCHGEHHAADKALKRLLAADGSQVVLGLILGFAGHRMPEADSDALAAVGCCSGVEVGATARERYGHGW